MTMGLRRLDAENWLTIDRNYISEHGIRADILSSKEKEGPPMSSWFGRCVCGGP